MKEKLYARRDNEALGEYYSRHVWAMTEEGLHEKSAIASELAWRDEQIDKLAKFKAYVHRRLDEAGVPADPDSPHKAEGCRIGGRLDFVLQRIPVAAPFTLGMEKTELMGVACYIVDGMVDSSTGERIYGMFATEEDAAAEDADAKAIGTVGELSLADWQLAAAHRNHMRLAFAKTRKPR